MRMGGLLILQLSLPEKWEARPDTYWIASTAALQVGRFGQRHAAMAVLFRVCLLLLGGILVWRQVQGITIVRLGWRSRSAHQ